MEVLWNPAPPLPTACPLPVRIPPRHRSAWDLGAALRGFLSGSADSHPELMQLLTNYALAVEESYVLLRCAGMGRRVGSGHDVV